MREKAAVKNEIMKRVKQKTGQKWRSKLKKMQHEKLQHKKSATEEEMQREKGATWKEPNMKKGAIWKERTKGTTWKHCNTKNGARWKECTTEKVHDENTVTWKK